MTKTTIVRGQSGNGTSGSFYAHIPGAPEIPELSAPARTNDFDIAAGPTSVIDTLLDADPEKSSKFWQDIADDSDTPPALLREMWRFAKPDLKSILAGNRALDFEVRELASVHESEFVRVAAAQWDGADAPFLERFEGDESFYVDEAVIRHPKVGAGQLRRLAKKDNVPLYDIAANPIAPPDLVEELFVTGDSMVARSVLDRQDVTESQKTRAMKHERADVRAIYARASISTMDQLDAMSTDPSAKVRIAVASNITIRDNYPLVDRLAADEDERVRKMAAYWVSTRSRY